MQMMWDNLLYYNLADGYRSLAPMLAKSWEMSSDAKEFTFSLRDGVKWTDGTSFTADDVVATMDRIVNPPEDIVPLPTTFYAMVDTIEKLDPLTVKFSLSSATPYFIELFAGDPLFWTTVMYQKKALEENDFDLRKVMSPGTGPFVVGEHRVAEFWRLEPNPNYWNPNLPYVDAALIINTPVWADRGAAVLTGQADWTWNASPGTWEEGKRRSDILVNNPRVLGCSFSYLNTTVKPLDDPRVRRAIHLGYDRTRHNAVISQVLRAEYLGRWLPPGANYAMESEDVAKLPGYRTDKTEDLVLAKKLLAEAGYPDGFEIDYVTSSDSASVEVVSPDVQAQLKENLNIQVNIRAVERSLVTGIQREGDFGWSGTFWDTPIREAEGMWAATFSTGGSQNFGKYSNPEFDNIMDLLRGEVDPLLRQSLYNQGAEILDLNPPGILTGCPRDLPMWHPHLKGLALGNRAFQLWGRWETVWLDK
jgi:peptide/nickel transport system substrate-binding protein